MLNPINKRYAKKSRYVYAAVFFAIELTLILLILFSPLPSIPVCYSAIAAAFIFALPFLFVDRGENALIIVALFFTLIADFFLVIEYGITGKFIYQCLGVSAFCAVHFFYFLYLYKLNGKEITLSLVFRLILSATLVAISFAVLKENGNYLSAVSVVCFCWLFLNIVVSFVNFKKTKTFSFGLLFFALCDIWVGLQCADGVFFNIPDGFIRNVVFPPFNTVWLCYGIAQTFIVLHLILNPQRNSEKT